ncbi:MAG: aspartate dehydrogenase domain-containing protein [Candidatus Heimdallarchaeaceae archaeon]
MKKVGIVGLGFIGQTIIDAINEGKVKAKLQAVYDINTEALHRVLNSNPSVRRMNDLLDFSDCDIVIESAVQAIVEPLFDEAIKNDIYFIPMSIGAFITNDVLYEKYKSLDAIKRKLILLPSGAIGGFDSIEALMLEGAEKVTLETRKPLKVFQNSEYVKQQNISLNSSQETVIFQGNAKQAAKNFPRSINVAARLALASLGPEQTNVRVVADSTIAKNIHTISIESEVGFYQFKFVNNPSPTNPKTSWIAALSAINVLKKIAE